MMITKSSMMLEERPVLVGVTARLFSVISVFRLGEIISAGAIPCQIQSYKEFCLGRQI